MTILLFVSLELSLVFQSTKGLRSPFTEVPGNPTYAVVGSDVRLKWNFLITHGTFRRVEIDQKRAGSFTTILGKIQDGKVLKNPVLPRNFKNRTTIEGNATLVISTVVKEDSSRFRCVIVFFNGNTISEGLTQLIVTSLRSPFTEVPGNPTYAVAGSDVRLKWNFLITHGTFRRVEIDQKRAGSFITILAKTQDGTVSKNPVLPRNFKNRTTIEGNATLVISTVVTGDSSRFRCVIVFFNANRIYEGLTQLIVTSLRSPFTEVPGNPTYAVAGSDVSLKWNFLITHGGTFKQVEIDQQRTGSFKTILMKTQNGTVMKNPVLPKKFKNRITIKGNATLVISTVVKEDSSRFRCAIVLPSWTIIYEGLTQLIVTITPSFETTPPSTKSIFEWQDLTIDCSATGTPKPNITWVQVLQSGNVVKSEGKGSSTLRVSKIRRPGGSSGKYVYECQAKNNPNEAAVTKRTEVTVQYGPTRLIKKYTKPQQTTVGSSFPLEWTFVANKTDKLERITLGIKPSSGYQRLVVISSSGISDTSMIPRNYKDRIAWTGNLSASVISFNLSNITLNDETEYDLLVKFTGIIQLRNSFDLVVVVPPSITVPPLNQIVKEGNSLQLTCKASGRPTPTITWEKDGKDVASGATLNVSKIKRTDSGVYTCSADNNVGEPRTAQSVVTVQYKAKINRNVSSKDGISKIGQAVELKCVADGVPVPQITWIKPDGSQLKQENRRVSTVSVDLRTETDFGDYKCSADNGFPPPDFIIINLSEITPTTPTNGQGKSNVLGDSNLYQFLHIIYGSIIAILLIIILVLLVIIRKLLQNQAGTRKQNSLVCSQCGQEAIQMDIIEEDEATVESSNVSSVDNESTQSPTPRGEYMPLVPRTRSWELKRSNINVIKIVGKGAFSKVGKATATGIRGVHGEIVVAVKMLKDNAPPSDRKDLLAELEVLKTLKPHPHVIKLMGCVTESEPPMVIIEYVPYGDLLGYLRKSRGLNDKYYNDPDVKPQTSLTSEQLIKFAWQIADGMNFLSSRKIIHRDLAARNVLIGEGTKCKVTDFGMARDVHQDEIYTKNTRGRLPVKWTAYESLLYGVYTTKSDVWSYGVLLYEIFTIGGCPYPNMDGRRIAALLQEGYRMPKPSHLKDELYVVMTDCWKENFDDRPNFAALRDQMAKLERNHRTYINLKEYDSSLYANVDELGAF